MPYELWTHLEWTILKSALVVLLNVTHKNALSFWPKKRGRFAQGQKFSLILVLQCYFIHHWPDSVECEVKPWEKKSFPAALKCASIHCISEVIEAWNLLVSSESRYTMAFWWILTVVALAYVICKFLLMLIPPNVPSIDVDASDGNTSSLKNLFMFVLLLLMEFDFSACVCVSLFLFCLYLNV